MTAQEYKRLRESLSMTQLELANRLGVNPTVISRRERGVVAVGPEAQISIRMLVSERAS